MAKGAFSKRLMTADKDNLKDWEVSAADVIATQQEIYKSKTAGIVAKLPRNHKNVLKVIAQHFSEKNS